ncbi:chemotaxis response regulator protein-glutamate methylesterase [Oleispirillum naphthae]|uniref:protein-glutamate methylesterase/protein-glutamine glutaminase n=1 Tax=Oleispirillum naphthae TaxID=2838853 RepID=UPI00308235C7
MVVDDSAVVRGLITRMLEDAADVQVVTSVPNGDAAVRALDRYDIEVVLLDIEMPVMDGMTALPLMLNKRPDLKVIMASTLTLHNADISLRALELGAVDYIPKPTATRELSGGQDFKRELLEKVVTLGAVLRRSGARRPAPQPARPGAAPARTPFQRPALGGGRASLLSPTAPIQLRQHKIEFPDIIAIGSSTGGPQALFKVLGDLRSGMPPKQPIIITQHMPATFTTILAEHITRVTGWPAKEAQDGEVLRGGNVYIAPGGFHMLVESKGVEQVLRVIDGPPENFCKPAVDPMFRSVAKVYGRRALAVILTGMGSDGAKGGAVLVEAGGTVIAQDEETAVVWGMPGTAAQAGICSAVLPLPEIGAYIKKVAARQ